MEENTPRKIAHVGIAVRSIEAVLPLYRDALGLEVAEVFDVPERGLRVAMLPCGESLIELMEPMHEGSQISAFIGKRGEGIHHLCLEIPEIEAKLDQLDADGVRLVSRHAEVGAEGCPVAFLHPKATGGVLLELLEDTTDP